MFRESWKNSLRALVLCFGMLVVLSGISQAVEVKPWNFLVYLNGDNDLDVFGEFDLQEMKKLSNMGANVLVFRDYRDQTVHTKILKIENGSSIPVYDYGSNIDSGDYRELVNFVRWSNSNYPSDKTSLIVWNHGSGWKGPKIPSTTIFKGVSYDEHSGNNITTGELGIAVNEIKMILGKNIDILGMDACLMQMAEVLYELKNAVTYFAAAEPLTPGAGWAYDSVLAALDKDPNISPLDFAKNMITSNIASYSGGSQGREDFQFSVVDTAKFATSMTTFNLFLSELNSNYSANKKAIDAAVNGAQIFPYADYTDYKDLIHFMNLLDSGISSSTLKAKLANARAGIQASIVGSDFSSNVFKNSFGIAVWVPNKTQYDQRKNMYKGLNFSKASLWDEFLDALTTAGVQAPKPTQGQR